MSNFITQILTLLTTPTGNLLYYIVLPFSIGMALQSAFNHWRASEFPQARRAMLGLGLLLLGQIALFMFSGLGWQGVIDPSATLPPMDRAYVLYAVIWITWLWAFPEPNRGADAAAVLLSLLVITAMVFSILSWSAQASLAAQTFASTTYNMTFADQIWQIASLTFIAIGILILFIRKPDGMWNGVMLLALGFLGHALNLMFPTEGDYAGVVRLSYMAAFPILLTLPQRFVAPVNLPAPPRQPSIKKDATIPERRRYSTDPKTFHALLALAAETNATKMSQAVTRAIAQTLLADLCFLIYLTDSKNQLMIAGGYDLIREDSLEGGSLNKTVAPMLANAMQRGRPLRMPASSTSADIKGLGDMLGLTNPGHLLSVPITTPDKDSLGGILLLSPYSDRTWTAEDQAFLANIAASLVPIIQRSQRITQMEQETALAKGRATELERINAELTAQVDALQNEKKTAVKSEDVSSLMVAQEESQHIIEQLQKENAELRSAGSKLARTAESSQIEKELKMTLQEVARLQNQVAESNMKLLQLEKGQATTRTTEQAEVIASIAQELRQPMSSVVGYTDLLLGESVGILGALQRKFVERIKSSTERIGQLIDDMIQVSTLETGLADLKPEAVDLNLIIDNAMSYTSSQVREKNISMHLELPKQVAAIHADREALQQILIHLLQNAGAATPVEGTIRLKVQTRTEEGQEFVLIQVTDSGGGIPSEDIPRVFTRLYRADNVLIQGVGDTGVGLSIAKTLTEAQNGRIWVESDPGSGSTFSVLLPIAGNGTEFKSARSKGKK